MYMLAFFSIILMLSGLTHAQDANCGLLPRLVVGEEGRVLHDNILNNQWC
jgi:hypothetical protein